MAYITDEERVFFNLNFANMKGEQGLRCSDQDFSHDKDDSPLPLNSRLLAPSLRTILKFKKGTISLRSVEKIVRVYNSLFTPQTNVHAFLTTDIFQNDMPHKIVYTLPNFFSGRYFCFYRSDNYADEVHGGILQVFEHEGIYKCYLLMGLFNSDQFSETANAVFPKGTNFSDVVNLRQRFNSFRKQQPDNSRYANISLATGIVRLLDRSILFDVANVNNADHVTICSLGTTHNLAQHFSGGMGMLFSPATTDLHTRVCKLLILREKDLTHSRIKEIMSMREHTYWHDALNISSSFTKFDRIELPDEDLNKEILNELNR